MWTFFGLLKPSALSKSLSSISAKLYVLHGHLPTNLYVLHGHLPTKLYLLNCHLPMLCEMNGEARNVCDSSCQKSRFFYVLHSAAFGPLSLPPLFLWIWDMASHVPVPYLDAQVARQSFLEKRMSQLERGTFWCPLSFVFWMRIWVGPMCISRKCSSWMDSELCGHLCVFICPLISLSVVIFRSVAYYHPRNYNR